MDTCATGSKDSSLQDQHRCAGDDVLRCYLLEGTFGAIVRDMGR